MPNYEKQLEALGDKKCEINRLIENLEAEKNKLNDIELKIFGSKSSKFYGLKLPGKYKSIQYIGDEYNIVPDLIQTIQDLIIKKYHEDNIKQYFKIYTHPIEKRTYYNPTSLAHNYCPQIMSDEQSKKSRYTNKFVQVAHRYQRKAGVKISIEAGGCYGTMSTENVNTSGLRIGGLKFVTDFDYNGNYDNCIKVLEPVLKRTRDNGDNRYGTKYSSNIRVIDKKVLYEACVNNCRNSEKVKMSWSKKQLFQHLLKYG